MPSYLQGPVPMGIYYMHREYGPPNPQGPLLTGHTYRSNILKKIKYVSTSTVRCDHTPT